MVPPRGAGNLRLTFYRTGGGRAGNRAAGTITELKTTVPYVNGVVNAEPATGGAEAESPDSLIRRGPVAMRHRDRAVTAQDYEDIAMLASPEVARVKCVPLKDLTTKQTQTGVVSLVIVPFSTEATPYPTLELLDAVRSHLDARRAAGARLVLVGPEYVRVTVGAEVVPGSPDTAGHLAEDVSAALTRYLHPLTGGAAGEGWGFGRKPHASDIYAVIESVAGVGYVRSIRLSGPKTPGGAEESPENFERLPDGQEFFLVHSGEHKIGLVYD
jgi:predicted phage baseplate assembly protein